MPNRFSIELTFPDSVYAWDNDQQISPICKRHGFGKALANCCKSGDREDACRFLLSRFKLDFYIIKQVDGEYKRVPATHIDKAYICREIYRDSGRNFTDSEEWCDIYLIWEAANVEYEQ